MDHRRMLRLGSALFGVGCFGLLSLQGCGTVCGDDGLAWTQKDNPACQAAGQTNTESNSGTESDSGTESASNSNSNPTEGTATETNSNSNSNSESNSNSNSNSESDTDATGPWCEDKDGDGFGDPTSCMPEMFPGSVPNSDDCDDGNPNTFPGSAESDSPTACMQDDDDDGYGDDNPGPGVDPGTDCADYDPVQHVECTGCEPGSAACVGDELQACNAEGTDYVATPCAFGCDDVGEQCWGALTVEAGPSVCIDPDQMIQLGAVAMGGDGNYSYDWTPPDGLSDPAIADPSATPMGLTEYTINVSDGEGNMASDTVSVFLKNQSLSLDPDLCTIYNFPFEQVIGDPAPDWQWNDQTKTLCQAVNAKASALFCGWELDNATITGSFGVNTADDDDWVGFMWGIQDTDHFYLFTWKQAAQTPYASCDNVPLNVPTGMMVKRIAVADGNLLPLSCHDLHEEADTANSAVLKTTADFYAMGWEDNTQYTFELTHQADGNMTIVVRRADNNNVVAMTSFMDTTYAKGQFGMYTKSQISACFNDFTVSCL